jgi:hypothetical protein
MYRSNFPWPRHYVKWVVSFTLPSTLPLGKRSPVSIGWETRWAPYPVWKIWRRENSWPYRDSNSVPSLIQPVASRYTDCAIPALIYYNSIDLREIGLDVTEWLIWLMIRDQWLALVNMVTNFRVPENDRRFVRGKTVHALMPRLWSIGTFFISLNIKRG